LRRQWEVREPLGSGVSGEGFSRSCRNCLGVALGGGLFASGEGNKCAPAGIFEAMDG